MFIGVLLIISIVGNFVIGHYLELPWQTISLLTVFPTLIIGSGGALLLIKNRNSTHDITQIIEKTTANEQIDLTQPVAETDNTFAMLAQAINQRIKRISETITSIEASASRLIPMSKQLGDTYSDISQKALMQTQHSQVVVSAMSEVQESSEIVSRDVSDIVSVVENGGERAKIANNATNNVVTELASLSTRMEAASIELNELISESEKIDNIIAIINEIAEQTNLLSLNAAIEAARAGEQGRGFAVVADEVRHLAMKTASATHEVKTVVQQIRDNTQKITDAFDLGQQATNAAVNSSNTAKDELELIHQAVDEIHSVTQRVMNSTQSQAQAAMKANESMTALVKLNTDALNDSNVHLVTNHDVAKLGYMLKEKLEKFKLQERGWDESSRPKRAAPDTNEAPPQSSQPEETTNESDVLF